MLIWKSVKNAFRKDKNGIRVLILENERISLMKELLWCSSSFFLQIENMNLWCFSVHFSHLGLALELSRLAIIFYLILIHRCLSCFEVIFIIALYTYDLLHALSNILENSAHLYQFVWPPLNSFSQHFIDPTAPRFMAIIFPIFIWPRSGASVFQPQTAINGILLTRLRTPGNREYRGHATNCKRCQKRRGGKKLRHCREGYRITSNNN